MKAKISQEPAHTRCIGVSGILEEIPHYINKKGITTDTVNIGIWLR